MAVKGKTMSFLQKLKIFILQIRLKIRLAIEYMIGNTYDYFLCFYPGNTGYFIKKLIKRLVNKLDLDDHNIQKIKNINKDSIVVYTSKNKWTLDFLYYHTKLKMLSLPYPQIGFDFKFFFFLTVKRLFQYFLCHFDYFIHNCQFLDAYSSNYITKELLDGKSGFVSLIQEEDFYKRFIKSSPDPLFILIELQKKIKKPIVMIPGNIIYITKPMKKNTGLADIFLGTYEKPGIIRRYLTILRHPEKIRVEIATPINLKTFIAKSEIEQLDSESQAYKLRSHLIDILNRQIKSITGPVLKSKQEMTEDILTKKSLREYLADYASKNKQTLRQTHKKAALYIKEIAANYNPRMINFGNWVVTWASKNLFEELIVNQDEINRMREKSTKAPLILVPCHKSHLDYLLIPFVMLHNNMPTPHIAAGKNLAFWPLGPLFRRGGAFFIRRTFKGAPLYSKIFSSYLEKLLYEGFNIKIFIEGGRSRTGKLLAPRPGGLSMLINAYSNKACSDLYFVPIFIGYDRVLEEDAYLKEIDDGKKNPETLKGLINARKFFKKKYGKVYMKFNEPISIKEYIKKKNFDISKTSTKEYLQFIKNFGYKLINSINTNSIATPHGIIASAVLNCPRNSFAKKLMTERLETYMNILIFSKAELSENLLIDQENTFNSVINTLISRNFIELADEDDKEITEETIFIVKDNKRAILDYYKNSVISFFVHYAYAAVAILEIDRLRFTSSDLIQRFNFLEQMFIDEFFFDDQTTCEEDISKSLKGFINQGIIVPDQSDSEMFNITSEGLRKLKWFASFLLPFLESYKTTLLYFEKFGHDNYKNKERARKIKSMGNKLYKDKIINLKESLSLINYQNAARFFVRSKVVRSNVVRSKVVRQEDNIESDIYKKIIDRLILLIST